MRWHGANAMSISSCLICFACKQEQSVIACWSAFEAASLVICCMLFAENAALPAGTGEQKMKSDST